MCSLCARQFFRLHLKDICGFSLITRHPATWKHVLPSTFVAYMCVWPAPPYVISKPLSVPSWIGTKERPPSMINCSKSPGFCIPMVPGLSSQHVTCSQHFFFFFFFSWADWGKASEQTQVLWSSVADAVRDNHKQEQLCLAKWIPTPPGTIAITSTNPPHPSSSPLLSPTLADIFLLASPPESRACPPPPQVQCPLHNLWHPPKKQTNKSEAGRPLLWGDGIRRSHDWWEGKQTNGVLVFTF